VFDVSDNMTERKRKKVILLRSKRKTAVGRGYLKESKESGIYVNSKRVDTIYDGVLLDYIYEPLDVAQEYGVSLDNYRLDINLKGGGRSSQAQVIRALVARALVKISPTKKLETAYHKLDRMLLVDDYRRKEPKKPLGRGARSIKQWSKR